MIDAGVEAAQKQDPMVTVQFEEEWARRMKAQFNVDDYLNVMTKVWESHFTADELKQLVLAQKQMNAGTQPILPEALREELGSQNTTIQSEIMGGCA